MENFYHKVFKVHLAEVGQNSPLGETESYFTRSMLTAALLLYEPVLINHVYC